MSLEEVLYDLNKALAMEGYKGDYEITLSKLDFDRFWLEFEKKKNFKVSYPENSTTLPVDYIKIAGPGSYFLIRRKKQEE